MSPSVWKRAQEIRDVLEEMSTINNILNHQMTMSYEANGMLLAKAAPYNAKLSDLRSLREQCVIQYRVNSFSDSD